MFGAVLAKALRLPGKLRALLNKMDYLNGLDLFSGIGGITIALSPWVRPVAYCENDRYAQGVLLSRMATGDLPTAPIWDDVRTFDGKPWAGSIDIIYGGFPCQDISVAGNGAGLAGKRSGLFFEIMRLAEEIFPTFIFLENVPAIRTRGLERVGKELAGLGYDCRWGLISAYDMGAPHKRERWFLLAQSLDDAASNDERGTIRNMVSANAVKGRPEKPIEDASGFARDAGQESAVLANFNLEYDKQEPGSLAETSTKTRKQKRGNGFVSSSSNYTGLWWAIEPNVGRVADGIPFRVDRIRGLGNAVVPAQAREAFRRLACINIS